MIKERTLDETNCPYYRGRKVMPGYNPFVTKHPDLLEQWDSINNVFLADPDNILDRSTVQVWWYCADNSAHKLLYYKKRNMKSCPYCKGRRRKKRHYL
ncbi:zinc-ribbon domain-containing protein [Lactiplantibacillus paraplantarum]|uniref:zinc-ribbon domain-containing protein n=2 Tax=Lactiplantibacillus paraplantarum TaxID=60520 RepID=UPI0009DFB6BD|nr:hypothetical protein [Lactiplantibacillus paraplantarum]RDG08436.1 hypothetical protein DQM08_14645 [Lactiplantibacillus paraplantarum]